MSVSGIVTPYVAGVAHSVTITVRIPPTPSTAPIGHSPLHQRDTRRSCRLTTPSPADPGSTSSASPLPSRRGLVSIRARDTVSTSLTASSGTSCHARRRGNPGGVRPDHACTAGTAGTITVKALDVYGTSPRATRHRHLHQHRCQAILLPIHLYRADPESTLQRHPQDAGTQVIRARDR